MAIARTSAEDAVLKQQEDDAAQKTAIEARIAIRQKVEQEKLDWRNKIATNKDEEREARDVAVFGPKKAEHEVVEEPIVEDDEVVEDPVIEDEEEVEPLAEPEDEDEEDVVSVKDPDGDDSDIDYDKSVTRLVNGKKVTKTLGEWLDVGTKVEDADLYYEEATRRAHAKPAIETPPFDEDAFLKEQNSKIQLGSEAEALAAQKKLLEYGSWKARQQSAAEAGQVAAKAAYNNFLKQFPDIAKDKILLSAAHALDEQLVQQGKKFAEDGLENFTKRMTYVGQEIRKWKKEQVSLTVKTKTKEDLVEKKQKIRNLKAANAKTGGTAAKAELSEKDARDAAVKDMFKSRKKGQF